MIDLNQYRRNIFQRAGVRECPHYSEDGVILEVFRQIGVGKNPRFESIDIDDEEDGDVAVLAAQYLESKRARR